jgi:hypothetical protein
VCVKKLLIFTYYHSYANIPALRKCRHCDYTSTAETESRWDPGNGRTDSLDPGLVVNRECCGPDLSSRGREELLLTANDIAVGTAGAALHFGSLVHKILGESTIRPSLLVRDYLSTIHRWLPVFHGERLIAATESSSLHSTPAMTLALLSIFLITRVPCGSGVHSMEKRNLYLATGFSFAALQQAGILNSELVASGLLLTAYECGHSLSEKAYLTLASCSAMARLLGLEKTGNGTLRDDFDGLPTSPIWSAIMVLDR